MEKPYNMNIYFETSSGVLYNGDTLKILKRMPDKSVDCAVTSPPYWALRDYKVEGQLGLEKTFYEYLEKLWEIYNEVYRVLKPTGTCWINIGDTYFGNGRSKLIKTKSLCMIPERFAIGMIERGWILRNQIIWYKPNAMPSSAKDRFTVDFEKIFFFVKNKKYYFQQQLEPLKTPKVLHRTAKSGYGSGELAASVRFGSDPKGRNKRTVWSINTKPFKGAHFAVFSPKIPEICIKAGCPEDGVVLDIFMGSGTTAEVAEKLGRKWIGIELNSEYCKLLKERFS